MQGCDSSQEEVEKKRWVLLPKGKTLCDCKLCVVDVSAR